MASASRPNPEVQAMLATPAVANRESLFGTEPWDAERTEAIVAELRSAPLTGPAPFPVHEVWDFEIEGTPVRGYRPSTDPDLPVVVYFHGGGWVFGDLETHDYPCRAMANAGRCLVLSVDYGLAPEHPFPEPVEECVTVTRWVVEHAASLGGDPRRVAVAGGSSGGNLAAAVALRARDSGFAELAAQVLVYPPLDATTSLPSYRENAHGYNLSATEMRFYWAAYHQGEADLHEPLLSPLHAPDLSGLPPTMILTAEFDVLRDDGEEFGRRLREHGVEAVVRRYDGQIHGFLGLRAISPDADHALLEIGKWLRRRFS